LTTFFLLRAARAHLRAFARGYSKDTIAEWVYRAARAERLVDGADEVHKMVLAKFMREEGRDFWMWSAGNRV
jgi:acyl-CoA dehydrogenase